MSFTSVQNLTLIPSSRGNPTEVEKLLDDAYPLVQKNNKIVSELKGLLCGLDSGGKSKNCLYIDH